MSKYKIKRKEATLYIKSKISESVPWLREILIKNKDYPYLTEDEYNLLEDSQQRFIDNRFRELLDYSISEWVIEYDNKEKPDDKIINCELCGQKNIKLLSKINNPKNNGSMIVGSSCINNYTQMKDAYGKTLGQIRKESNSVTNRKLKNEEILEKRFPNILNNIDKFNKIMSGNEYLIRSDIERKYRELNNDVNTKYNKYIKLKTISDKRILEIGEINNRILYFFKTFDDYKNECEKNIFGLNKDICRWLNLNYDYNLNSKLTKDGLITRETISQIKEPNFLAKIILQFKEQLLSNNLVLKNNNIGKFFKVSIGNSNIFFDIDSNNFIEDYKEYLFGEISNIKVNKNSIIKNAIISDNQSLNNALNLLVNSNVSKSEYTYKFSDTSFNEISFYNKSDKKFHVLKFREFINYFKVCILENNVNAKKEDILRYIKDKSELYSYSDYNEHLKNYGLNIKDI